MKKTLSMILAALMVAGAAATTVVAEGEEINLCEVATISYIGSAQPTLTKTFKIAEEVYETVTIENNLEDLFDGDITTGFCLDDNNSDNAVILELECPATVTYFTFSGVDTNADGIIDTPWDIHHTTLYGSNDGENWELIMVFGDPYWEYDDYAYDLETIFRTTYATEYAFDGEEDEDVDMMEPAAFQYYKVCGDESGWPCWGEVEVWGVLEEVETPDYLVGDLDGSGVVDLADAILLFNHSMLGDIYPIDYAGNIDFTGDEVVDLADAILLFNHSMLPDIYPLA